MRGTLSLAVAALVIVASVGRADEPPRPPEGMRLVPVASGQAWTAPDGGGLCLDLPAVRYTAEVRRYYETRIKVAEDYAERTGWKAALVGLSVGLAVGASVALAKR